jgi:hypothetical protein
MPTHHPLPIFQLTINISSLSKTFTFQRMEDLIKCVAICPRSLQTGDKCLDSHFIELGRNDPHVGEY